jgi:putative ABC transport system substrate-binding protein
VTTGIVASLARPGSNITGLATLYPEISGKQLELLREIDPKCSRVAVLGNSSIPGNSQTIKETHVAAEPLGVKIEYLDIKKPEDIETGFEAVKKMRADAILALASPLLNTHRKELIALSIKSRVPTIYSARNGRRGRPDYLWREC